MSEEGQPLENQGVPAGGGESEATDESATLSPEDLKAQIDAIKAENQNLQKKMGDMSSELGETRKKASFYEAKIMEQMNQGPSMWSQINQPQAQQAPQQEDFDYDNPVESVKKMIRTEFQQAQRQREQQEAVYNFQDGYSRAKKERPDLFENADDDEATKQTMWALHQQGKISHHDLRSPNMWVGFAFQRQAQKRGFKFENPSNPVDVTQTERPAQARPEEGSKAQFTPEQQQMVEIMGNAVGKKFDAKNVGKYRRGGK